MDLPNLESLDVYGKRVIVRADLDIEAQDFEKDLRIRSLIPTLDYLKEHKAEIVLIGHRGRPEGKYDENLSLKSFQSYFSKWGARVEENLRFNRGEERNDLGFAKELSTLGDFYVNEAFGNSHREHASIVGVPKLLPHAAGFHFIKEVENLSKVFGSKALFILGGVKEDKLEYLAGLGKIAEKILIGGRLPVYLEDKEIDKDKVVVANLMPDKEDLTINSIERFEKEIAKAGTIVLSGPMGKFEDLGHRQGTERIFKAVSLSSAFKVVGGGDSLSVISIYNLKNKFDWVSVGGGAMLEFLVKKTLPGIEALIV